MNIREVLADLGRYDSESLILVAREAILTPETEALVVPIPDTLDVDPSVPGFDYLIEVYHAKDVLDTWSQWRNNRIPTVEEAIEAIRFYQENDAYLPTGDSWYGDPSPE